MTDLIDIDLIQRRISEFEGLPFRDRRYVETARLTQTVPPSGDRAISCQRLVELAGDFGLLGNVRQCALSGSGEHAMLSKSETLACCLLPGGFERALGR